MRKRIKRIILHWSDSHPFTTVADIRAWHKARGWKDIGYHRVILHPAAQPSAKDWQDIVKIGRPIDDDIYMDDWEVGAHVLGHNSGSIGICVVSKPGLRLHDLQKSAIINVVKVMVKRFGLTLNDVKGHRDFMATMCPGDEISKLIVQIKKGEL